MEPWWVFLFLSQVHVAVVCWPRFPKWCISMSLWAVMLLESMHVCLRLLHINEVLKGSTQERRGSFMQEVLQGVIGEDNHLSKLRLYNVDIFRQQRKERWLSQGQESPFKEDFLTCGHQYCSVTNYMVWVQEWVASHVTSDICWIWWITIRYVCFSPLTLKVNLFGLQYAIADVYLLIGPLLVFMG